MYHHANPTGLASRLVARTAAPLLAMLMLIPVLPARAQAPAPRPDVLVFANGDQLTGKLTEVINGKVTFHSDMLGDVTVSLDRVKSLRTSQPFAVIRQGQVVTNTTPDAAVPRGPLTIANQQVQVEEGGGGAANVPEAQVQYVVEQAAYESQMHGRAGVFGGWSGALTGGAALVDATQTSRTFSGGAALVRTAPAVNWLAPRNRSSVDFSAAYGSVSSPNVTPTKTNILHAALEQDWFLWPRFFTLAVASFDHNYSQGLSLQQIYGGGAGYTLIKNPVQELDLKTDVHFERQIFSATPGVVPAIVSPSKNLVGMDFGDTYLRHLVHGIVFSQNLTLTPAFNQTNAASALVAASLLFPVHNRFSFNLGAQDAFLNDPGFGSKKNSFQFTAGVGYSLP